MKLQTIKRIYDVLKSEGYKPTITVRHHKCYNGTWGCIRLKFKTEFGHESLWSKSYNYRYILKQLDGIPFKSEAF